MVNEYFDISEICTMLNTTSRTLRFYEQKGLISSIRIGSSERRHYTEEQRDKIKNILILRKLGLSVKQIQELQKQDKDLQSALYEKRAEIGALINTKLMEIALLDQALEQLHNADSIDGLSTKLQTVSQNSDLIEIISECNHAIVSGNTDLLYKHLSVTMKEYMPPSAYEKMRDDTIKPLGSYCGFEQLETDRTYPNVLHQYVRYEHLGLKIRYVFIDNKIHGLWLGYYKLT